MEREEKECVCMSVCVYSDADTQLAFSPCLVWSVELKL